MAPDASLTWSWYHNLYRVVLPHAEFISDKHTWGWLGLRKCGSSHKFAMEMCSSVESAGPMFPCPQRIVILDQLQPSGEWSSQNPWTRAISPALLRAPTAHFPGVFPKRCSGDVSPSEREREREKSALMRVVWCKWTQTTSYLPTNLPTHLPTFLPTLPNFLTTYLPS